LLTDGAGNIHIQDTLNHGKGIPHTENNFPLP
jgi:hypothetical protein